VRHALGARRWRLVRQFLTESLLLAVIGGALGVLAATWMLDAIVALIPKSAPRVGEIGLDGRSILFAVACSLGASILFGLAPILHARKTDIHSSLKEGSLRTTGSKARLRVRRALVITEIALAVVLVVGCGVMLKSFLRLQDVNLGFAPEKLLTAELELPAHAYTDNAAVNGFWQRVQDRVHALPGVEGATLVSGLPPVRPLNANDIGFPDRPEPVRGDRSGVPWNVDYWQAVGDDAFATLGARLVKGRTFAPTDSADAPGVVVVNAAFAERFFPGQDAIGQRITLAPWFDEDDPEEKDKVHHQTIVGVVADLKQAGVDRPAGTEVFFSLWQAPKQISEAFRTATLVVRTTGDPAGMAPSLARAVASVDPTLPVSKLRTMNDVVWEAVARPRFLTFLLTAFAAMALLLAGVGIYGVMSHTVAQRTHEIGVRVALGAQPKQVRRMVLRQAGVLAGIGVVIGVAASIGLQVVLGAELRGALYGGTLGNPVLLGVVALGVTGAALLATWVPARRATQVQPTVALRTE
jgi:putative ABC transport system permease protein